MMDEYPCIAPLLVMPINCRIRREVFGQVAPMAPIFQLIQNAIENLPFGPTPADGSVFSVATEAQSIPIRDRSNYWNTAFLSHYSERSQMGSMTPYRQFSYPTPETHPHWLELLGSTPASAPNFNTDYPLSHRAAIVYFVLRVLPSPPYLGTTPATLRIKYLSASFQKC